MCLCPYRLIYDYSDPNMTDNKVLFSRVDYGCFMKAFFPMVKRAEYLMSIEQWIVDNVILVKASSTFEEWMKNTEIAAETNASQKHQLFLRYLFMLELIENIMMDMSFPTTPQKLREYLEEAHFAKISEFFPDRTWSLMNGPNENSSSMEICTLLSMTVNVFASEIILFTKT